MSALKIATAASGLALTASAFAYSQKQTTDFSQTAKTVSETGTPAGISQQGEKKKLPSEFFQFTIGGYKLGHGA
ncbi:hypothetical protein MBLNU230_g5179t1 [Neophaeotheca triangularis]